MTYEGDASPELADVLSRHDGVLGVDSAMKYLTRDALRWRVSSGRWQQPCRGIVVAQSGPLTEFQALRIAALWAGPGGALAGLTAASLEGLQGFTDRGPLAERPIHVPPDRQAPRRNSAGRRRWLDAVWETARLVVEVDGRHHMDAAQYWADMDRDNDLTVDGYRVLRFPAFLVRYHPGCVAGKIHAALRPGVADPDSGLTRTG